jgi:TRAP-type C4-dicarboxylate transport system permease small subunit
MRAALDKLYDLCGYIAAVFLVGIAASIVAQIIYRLRGITFDATEAAGLCLAASTFFGLAHTFRRGAHVRINLLVDRLPQRFRQPVEILNCLIGTAVVSFLAWNVIALAIQSYQFNDVSPGLMAVPFWIPQAGVAFGVTVLAIAFIDELIWLLRGGKPRYEAPDEIGIDQPVA